VFPFRYGRRNSIHLSTPAPARTCVGGVGGVWFQYCIVDAWSLLVWVPVMVPHTREAGVGWVTSPRPISTGRLGIAAVYLRPIYPMVCRGPYPISGWETLS
jgi:hypothetical protein